MSCLNKDDAESIYLTVRMTINNDMNQDNNKIKELKSVTLIEKKDYYNDSDN